MRKLCGPEVFLCLCFVHMVRCKATETRHLFTGGLWVLENKRSGLSQNEISWFICAYPALDIDDISFYFLGNLCYGNSCLPVLQPAGKAWEAVAAALGARGSLGLRGCFTSSGGNRCTDLQTLHSHCVRLGHWFCHCGLLWASAEEGLDVALYCKIATTCKPQTGHHMKECG